MNRPFMKSSGIAKLSKAVENSVKWIEESVNSWLGKREVNVATRALLIYAVGCLTVSLYLSTLASSQYILIGQRVCHLLGSSCGVALSIIKMTSVFPSIRFLPEKHKKIINLSNVFKQKKRPFICSLNIIASLTQKHFRKSIDERKMLGTLLLKVSLQLRNLSECLDKKPLQEAVSLLRSLERFRHVNLRGESTLQMLNNSNRVEEHSRTENRSKSNVVVYEYSNTHR